MNNEFTKIKSGNYVRYVLEDGGSGGATSGATSVGSISSMDTPIGKDQIVVQSRMGPKEPPKPRNFVAKNAKMGGAGKMKDKSKTLPRHEKHKKPVAEGVNDLSYDAQSLITKLRRDVEEKRLQPTPQAVLAAARELAGDMEFAPQLLVQQVLGKGLAEGSGGNKTHLAMAYLKAVMMAPTGTPENERIRNWQEELADEFDIEMDTAVLAQMLPQFDSMLQAGKLDKLQNRMASRGELEIGEAEEFNGEYDDEAGMAQSNLLTTARAVMGLLKTIKDRDNLPEWGQEKIAKAEMMLVSVWDYLQSQKEMGNDPQVEAYGRYDRRDAYQRDYDHSVAGMGRGNNHRDDERHDLDPSDWYIVKDGKMYKVSVYPNQEQEAMSRGYSPTRDEAKARAGEQGVAEGSYNDYLAGMLENVLGERSKSKAQWDLMHAVAHNPQFANQVKIKPSVGQEFSAADAGHERSALPDRVLKKNKK